MDVSVIIVNWNTRDVLRDCLLSVYDQTSEIEYEVIVIDNASIDDSVSMVRAEFPQVYLIENSENRGFAAANNQGMEIAKGQYVLLLNSDTIILDNAISKTLEFAKDRPNASVVGCKVLNPDRTLQPTCFMFPSVFNRLLFTTYLYKIFPRSRFFGRERMSWWDRKDEQEVDVVTGCFMMVRQEAIKRVGMMDTQFFMYAEEIDWCYRFYKAGWKNLYTPAPQIIHLGNVSAAKYRNERAVLKDISDIRLMFKHWPKWKACFGVILKITFYLSRLLLMMPLLIFNRNYTNRNIAKNHLTGLKCCLGFRKILIKAN